MRNTYWASSPAPAIGVNLLFAGDSPHNLCRKHHLEFQSFAEKVSSGMIVTSTFPEAEIIGDEGEGRAQTVWEVPLVPAPGRSTPGKLHAGHGDRQSIRPGKIAEIFAANRIYYYHKVTQGYDTLEKNKVYGVFG